MYPKLLLRENYFSYLSLKNKNKNEVLENNLKLFLKTFFLFLKMFVNIDISSCFCETPCNLTFNFHLLG